MRQKVTDCNMYRLWRLRLSSPHTATHDTATLEITNSVNLLSFQPHVEVTLSTSNDTIIKSVLIFAEGIFEVNIFTITTRFLNYNFFKGRESRCPSQGSDLQCLYSSLSATGRSH